MATINTSIRVSDGMTAPLRNMSNALNIVLSNFEKMQRASSRAVDTKSIAAARSELASAAHSFDQIETEIREAREEQERFNDSVKKTDGYVNTARSTLNKMALGVAAVSAAIGVAVNKVAEFSDNVVQTKARLDMMNDGSQTTAELQQKIYDSATRSRGAYQDTADAVSKMGILAGEAFSGNDEIIAFMEQVNKQFTISGTSVEGMQAAMLQLTQAMGSGVLRGEELNSILEQAPTITQTIAKHLAVSTGELRNMAAKGLVTSSVVKEALLGAAEETNAKFESMPVTFGQVWTDFKNRALFAFQPVLEKINELANSGQLQEYVERAANALAKMGDVALNVFTWMMEHSTLVKGILIGVAAAIGVMTAAMWAFNIAALANPVVLIILGIMAAVALLAAAIYGIVSHWDAIKAAAASCWESIKTAFGAAGAWFKGVWDSIVGAWNGAIETIKNAWNAVAGFFSGIWSAISNGAANIWNNVVTVWNSAVNSLKSVWNSITDFFSGLWTGIVNGATNIWSGIVSAWNSVVNTVKSVWGGITGFFASIWNSIWSVISPVVNAIHNLISAVFGTIFQIVSAVVQGIWATIVRVFTAISNTCSTIWNGIKTVINTVVNAVWSFITTTWNTIYMTISTVLTNIWTFITNVWNTIYTTISSVLNSVWTTITTVWNTVLTTITTILTAIWNAIITIWNTIYTTISTVLTSIWNTITSIWSSVLSTITGVMNSIWNSIQNAWNNIVSTVTSKVSEVYNNIKTKFNEILNFIGGIKDQFVQKGKDIIQGLIDGISSKINAVADKIRQIGTTISDGVKNFFQIGSPSKLMREMGNFTFEGFGLGLADQIKNIRGTTLDMAATVEANAVPNISSLSVMDMPMNVSVMPNYINREIPVFQVPSGPIMSQAQPETYDVGNTQKQSFLELRGTVGEKTQTTIIHAPVNVTIENENNIDSEMDLSDIIKRMSTGIYAQVSGRLEADYGV